MKQTLFLMLVLAAILLAGACSRKVKKAAEVTPMTPRPEAGMIAGYPEQVPEPDSKDHGTLTIILKRGPCFGKCPWYEVAIYDNGTVLYNGKKYVQHSGKYTLRTKPETVRALANQAEKIGFFQMAGEYPEDKSHRISDLPQLDLTVRSGRNFKTIKMVNEIPPALVQYFKDIEKAVETLSFPEKPDTEK